MPDNRDAILLETVKTHRTRLRAAFLFGEMSERRVANDNLKRLVGSLVLAAVISAGCVGFAFIASLLAGQAAVRQAQAGEGPPTQPPYAADSFDRTSPDGWGPADLGGAWAALGDPAALSVSDGAARIAMEDGARGAHLAGQLRDSTDLLVTLARTEDPAAIGVLGRRIGPGQDYRALVQVSPAGRVSIALRGNTTVGSDPGPRALSPTIILLGTPQVGDPITVRLQVKGANATTIRAKVWWGGGEPQDWTVAATDSSAGLQRPGTIGLLAGSRNGGELAVLDFLARPANP